MLSRRAKGWLLVAAVVGGLVTWHEELWALKRRWDDARDFAARVGDPAVYEACFSRGFRGPECERWQVKAQPNPEYWPYPDKPAFVWPEGPKKQVYRPGMTRVEYFEALCEAEAGEFIYKTVKAEGIYMIRPRMKEAEERMRDRYGVEDPYGEGQGDGWPAQLGVPGAAMVGPIVHHRLSTPMYRFVETPTLPLPTAHTDVGLFDESFRATANSVARYRVFSAPSGKQYQDYRAATADILTAKVGFVWRGIRRLYDRELGLAGGEVAVVDLETNEVLGLRRGFIMGQRLKTGGLWWLTGATCPRYAGFDDLAKIRRRNKDGDYLMLFLPKVAIPEYRKATD